MDEIRLDNLEVIDDLEGEQDANDIDSETEQDDTEKDDSFHIFRGHSESVFVVAWNPVKTDDIVSGGQDDVAFLWKTCPSDATNVEELPYKKLEGHSDSIIAASFNHDGTMVATASMDGLTKVWSTEGALLRTLEGPTDALEWMCWHPRGNVLVAGGQDFSSWMWNAQTGACMQVFSGHGGAVTCGTFRSDGQAVITTGDDSDPSLKIWNPKTAECITTIAAHGFHEAGINCLDVTKDGSLSLTGSLDQTARLCNLSAGKPTATLREHADSVEAVCWVDSVLPIFVTAGLDGKAIVWDKTSQTRRQIYNHPEGVVCMQSFEDSTFLLTGCMDGYVRIWDARMDVVIREFLGSPTTVQCLSIGPDQNRILAGYDDASVRVFDIRM